MTATLAVWWRLRRGGARESRVPDVLAVLAFAVTTAALLVTVGGVRAFMALDTGDEQGVGQLYVTLALLAAGLMTVPVLTLGGTAARLAVARRDQRMAALRLAGATSGQVALMTLAEAAVQAVVGAVLGAALYAALLVPLGGLVFQGHALGASALWVGPLLLGAVVAAVVVLAVLSGLAGLARVVVSPLGVAARTTPARLRAVRLLVAVLAVVGWLAVTQVMGQVGYGVLLLVLLGAVATVNLVGPWVVMLIGSVVASAARTPATLLAARRIVDDPRSTWRAVGAVALGVLVAGLSAVLAGAGGSGPDADGPERFLPADLATGSLVTLAVIAVVAATSTGVVQAARVLDQREQYRALALAGTEVATLHAARLREVAIPLAVAVGLAGGFVLLLLLPFSAAIGAVLVVRVLLAVALAVGLLLLAVVASRPLVTQVTRLS